MSEYVCVCEREIKTARWISRAAYSLNTAYHNITGKRERECVCL